MAEKKVYLSRKPNLSVSWPVPGATPNTIVDKALHFTNGLLETDNKDEQDHIEGLSSFGDTITLAEPADPLIAAQVAATALRDAADKLDADADAAEKARAELDAKPKRLRAVADKADADATKAESALAALKKVPAKV
jgi:hypothetical protein